MVHLLEGVVTERVCLLSALLLEWSGLNLRCSDVHGFCPHLHPWAGWRCSWYRRTEWFEESVRKIKSNARKFKVLEEWNHREWSLCSDKWTPRGRAVRGRQRLLLEGGAWECCVAQVAMIWAWKVMTYGAPAELQVEAVPRCALGKEMWPEVLRV